MKNTLTLFIGLMLFASCNGESEAEKNTVKKDTIHDQESVHYPKENLTRAYFASGCFWCVEAVFESIEGVEEAISGYSGGHTSEPTYRSIGTGNTGHSESVEVIYDSTVVSYNQLLRVYYDSHDPTTINGQHPDFGSQYRSMIFYRNAKEKELANQYKFDLDKSGDYPKPIATEIVPFKKFWAAEGYHQNYEKLHPNESYVKNVSIPRLKKAQAKFPELLKK